MTIHDVIVLIGLSLFLGWVTRKGQRKNLLLLGSSLVFYWLQPSLPLRYLSFWLPTATFFLVILSWVCTSSYQQRWERETIQTAGFMTLIILMVGLTRYLGLGNLFATLYPPRLLRVVVFLLVTLGVIAILLRKETFSNAALWGLFSFFLLLFVILKTPYFAQMASRMWRYVVDQAPGLARAEDIKWLGFSYLTFRILHTIRDRIKGRLSESSLKEYLIYTLFFPAISAGPIDRIGHFLRELPEDQRSFEKDIIQGGRRLVIGLFKKFVVADTLSMIALGPENVSQIQSTGGAWILLYAFTLQIFFDFSGYTDMAIGLARFMNISLPENFNKPYRRQNLTQFWNNWHMTLTKWIRSYFFYPLTRALRSKGTFSVFGVLLITQISTMMLIGLWHGVSLGFVIWGLWHGIGLLVQNRWSTFFKSRLSKLELPSKLDPWLGGVGTFLTFHYVALGWVWFVTPHLSQGWEVMMWLLGVVS
ncbi:MAG: MBOAT family protein [Anaerolineales bacterium]|nr:MBOAT family protein [Anaerolineales bacterium]